MKHLIWSSLPNVAKESGNKFHVPHFTDKALVAEHIERKNKFQYVTFVMPGSYMTSCTVQFELIDFPSQAFYYQNFQTFFPPKTVDGKLTFTLPETTSITAFDVDDTGGVVHHAFNHPHRWGNGTIRFCQGSFVNLHPGDYIPISGDHLTPDDIVNDFNAVNKTNAVVKLVKRDDYAKQHSPGAKEMAEMVRQVVFLSLSSTVAFELQR